VGKSSAKCRNQEWNGNFDSQFELIIGRIIKLISFGQPMGAKETMNAKLPIKMVTFLKHPLCN